MEDYPGEEVVDGDGGGKDAQHHSGAEDAQRKVEHIIGEQRQSGKEGNAPHELHPGEAFVHQPLNAFTTNWIFALLSDQNVPLPNLHENLLHRCGTALVGGGGVGFGRAHLVGGGVAAKGAIIADGTAAHAGAV